MLRLRSCLLSLEGTLTSLWGMSRWRGCLVLVACVSVLVAAGSSQAALGGTQPVGSEFAGVRAAQAANTALRLRPEDPLADRLRRSLDLYRAEIRRDTPPPESR